MPRVDRYRTITGLVCGEAELHRTHRDSNPLPRIRAQRTSNAILKKAFANARPGETPGEALRRMLDEDMKKNYRLGLAELKDT